MKWIMMILALSAGVSLCIFVSIPAILFIVFMLGWMSIKKIQHNFD